jgi:MYXO-CTERM domain-containing protein
VESDAHVTSRRGVNRVDGAKQKVLQWALSGAVLVVTASVTSTASAYCRTTTCDSQIENCAIDPVTRCPLTGNVLYWPDACVTFGVHQAGSPLRRISYDTAQRVARNAFQSWLSVDCGAGQMPSIGAVYLGSVECDQVQYNYPDVGEQFAPGPNANIIVFRDSFWPYRESIQDERITLALTTITYLKETGEIVDADIEINSANVVLSTSETNVTNDLQAILTHEFGHFLGFAHSNVPNSVMHRTYNVTTNDGTLRRLSQDDRLAVCDAYRPGEIEVADCRGAGPRFGFSRECYTPGQASAGLLCNVSPAPGGAGAGAWPWALGVLALIGGAFARIVRPKD